ncbi:MAG TPA: SagB/ThcOx family dehydrogenase [candidate division Zixibacteria bacterium]|nr:SagB/ThcOx family dehydrogenase [candidate division Zixibacteria bacterium]
MGQIIQLPPPPGNDIDLHSAIESRRSRRTFGDGAVTFEQISELLWSSAGITDPGGRLRAAPSAGATYPVDTYILVERAEGLAPGLYRYIEKDHALELIEEGNLAGKLSEASLGQNSVRTAAVSILLYVIVERTASRYGDRADRYVNMEVGHIAQNIYLTAEGLNLSTVAIGAFDDDAVAQLFEVDGALRYYMAIGTRPE